MDRFDVIVIGAGIAGASAAWAIAEGARVLLLEAEDRPGRHATGRSVATFSETFGTRTIGVLTAASRGFLERPPAGFATAPLITRLPSLTIADAARVGALDRAVTAAAQRGKRVDRLDRDATLALAPLLRPERVAGGTLVPDAGSLDVDALHQAFLRGLRARGGTLACDARVDAIVRERDAWTVRAGARAWGAATIVNAAGAWGDVVARAAGLAPLALRPLKRTAFVLDSPPGLDIARLPNVVDVDRSWYLKPDAGRLLGSPVDEIPSAPGDVWADDLDVAAALERIAADTLLPPARPRAIWAGLRTFAPDREPVCGFAPDARGFLWLVGQGGHGIQTAPALARAAAALALGRAWPGDLGVAPDALAPARLSGG